MSNLARIFMPDGQVVLPPRAPRTWVDETPGVIGTPLRAPFVQADAGGGVAWHRQRPLFQGIAAGVQSIPTGTWTAVTGLSELIDNYAGHSDTSNTGRYFAPSTNSEEAAGDWYLCSGYVPYNSTDAAHVHVAGFRKNGAGTVLEGGKVPGGTSHVVDTMAIDLVQMIGLDGDFVELMAFQNTGGAINTIVSGKTPSLTLRWVCANTAWAGAATPALPGVPHTWVDSDRATATATGTVGGHTLVPLNRELRDAVNFLNNPPIARLTSQGTSQTIPTGSGTWTSVQFPSESVDNYGGHDNVTNNTRYTCQRAGLYLVAGCASISEGDAASTNNGYRAVRLQQTFAAGGTTTYAGWTCLPMTGTGSTGTALWAAGLVRMAAGDYVELQMQQTQSSGTTTRTVRNGAGDASKMVVVWMAQ